MDSLITAAARALAAGDSIGALNRVALRNDPPALALRGIALAQLGGLEQARDLLKRAARAFGAREALPRARCIVAEAEIALALRDLGWPRKMLDTARAILAHHGDRANAAHALYLEIRRLVLIGRLDQAESMLTGRDPASLPPALRVIHELVIAGIALRRVWPAAARAALVRAGRAADEAGIAALSAEVENAGTALERPAARLITHAGERILLLDDVASLLASRMLIVDACRHVVRTGDDVVSLVRRPVLFSLVRALGEAWPDDVPRERLVQRAFRARRADESHRARLRVEIGRLRAALRSIAAVTATDRGFFLVPRQQSEVALLAPPREEEHSAITGLLADGESWSSSALALALGTSQRSVQRALEELAATDKVQSWGQGRARRWVTPSVPGFTTTLLLPAPPPGG